MLAEDGNFILAKSGPFPRKMEKYGGGVCTRMGTILIVGCATDQLDLCCYLVLFGRRRINCHGLGGYNIIMVASCKMDRAG